MEPGQRIPAFALPDQDGKRRTVADLAGPRGLVLYRHSITVAAAGCR